MAMAGDGPVPAPFSWQNRVFSHNDISRVRSTARQEESANSRKFGFKFASSGPSVYHNIRLRNQRKGRVVS